MPFERGSLSLRMFYLGGDLPRTAAELFARDAVPPLRTLGVDPAEGWVGGRHLLDLPVTADNAWYGGFLRLGLLRAERRVPAPLLRAHIALAESARQDRTGKAVLSRRDRLEIRQEVVARLLPQMPPTLRAAGFVAVPEERLLYATVLSETATDRFRVQFLKTTGVELLPVEPATAAAQRRKADVRDWRPASFSPELPDDGMEPAPGRDFLTWLWFFSEVRGGQWKSQSLGTFGTLVEGPLLFVREGEGAQEVALRRGSPTLSAEARACLLAGKKLRRARFLLARKDEQWQAAVDADTFALRGLKLPPPPDRGLDPLSLFQDRMLKLAVFRDALLGLYDRFVEDRGDAKRWAATQKEIHRWVAERQAKA